MRRECVPCVKRVALVRSATGDKSVAATGSRSVFFWGARAEFIRGSGTRVCRRYRLLFLGAFNCVWGGIWEATQGGLASILKAELLVWAEANGAVSVR